MEYFSTVFENSRPQTLDPIIGVLDWSSETKSGMGALVDVSYQSIKSQAACLLSFSKDSNATNTQKKITTIELIIFY